MHIELAGLAVLCDDPRASARWLCEHFGFELHIDIGWYFNTQHPEHPNLAIDFVQRDHPSNHELLKGRPSHQLIAFLVPDADAEESRLRAAGLDVFLPLTTEPWGQRRFQVSGPEGLFVEVLQLVEPDPQWMADHGLAT